MQILPRVDADMGGHGGKEQVAGRSQIGDSHPLALQLGEAASGIIDKKLEATDMHAAEHRQVNAAIEAGDEHGCEVRAEINLAARNPFRRVMARSQTHVTNIGKALGAEQFFGDVLRSNANAVNPGNAHGGCFEATLRGRRRRRTQ